MGEGEGLCLRTRQHPASYIQPSIQHPASCSLQPASCILHSASLFFYPTSCILHPVSCILCPASCILHRPAFCILHPASCILNPASSLASYVLLCASLLDSFREKEVRSPSPSGSALSEHPRLDLRSRPYRDPGPHDGRTRHLVVDGVTRSLAEVQTLRLKFEIPKFYGGNRPGDKHTCLVRHTKCGLGKALLSIQL